MSIMKRKHFLCSEMQHLSMNALGIACVSRNSEVSDEALPMVTIYRHEDVSDQLYVYHYPDQLIPLTQEEYERLLSYFMFQRAPLLHDSLNRIEKGELHALCVLCEELQLPDLKSEFDWTILPRRNDSAIAFDSQRQE